MQNKNNLPEDVSEPSNQQHTPEMPAINAPAVPEGLKDQSGASQKLPGLSLRQKIRTLPVLGYLLGWIFSILRLPAHRAFAAQEMANLRQQNHQLSLRLDASELRAEQQMAAVLQKLDTQFWQLHDQQHTLALLTQRSDEASAQIHGLKDALLHGAERSSRIEINFHELRNDLIALAGRHQAIEEIGIEARLHTLDLLDAGKRLMKLEQIHADRQFKAIKHLLKINAAEELQRQASIATLENTIASLQRQSAVNSAGSGLSSSHTLQTEEILLKTEQTQVVAKQSQTLTQNPASHSGFDQQQFYLDFEDQFRGSRAEIKARQEVYLPYLASLKKAGLPLVDVGCGRGEWLELMGEQGFDAVGIDLNAAMVAACVERGMAAKVADAIDYLRRLPAASVAVVSGFHIIEHLPFEQLIALYDAALHALCEGGMIIFETPNPENLIIGACNFYYDPTHLHPVVPDVARFIALQRGFKQAEILRLHPFPDDYQMQGSTQADQALNKFLFSAQDYAVIAHK